MSFLDDLVFAFELDEASGDRTALFNDGVSDTATESGGTVGQEATAWHNEGAATSRGGPYLVVADASGNRLGKRDWTFDGYFDKYSNSNAAAMCRKGTHLYIFWAPWTSTIHVEVDNAGYTKEISGGGGYVRVSHDWAAHTITIQTGLGVTTESYTITNDDSGGDDWRFAGGDPLGGLDGFVDEFCMWLRTLTESEGNARAAGSKFIDSFNSNPPVPSYNDGRNWIHAGHGKTLVMPMQNGGGAVADGDWSSVGTALPSGVTLNSDGSLTIGPTAALGTTSGIIIRGTNADGTGDTVAMKLVVLPHMPAGSYSCVPGERFDTPGYVGYCGIDPADGTLDHVEISFNGGAAVSVSAEVFDEERGILVWGTLFDPSEFADGPVTVDIEAFPNEGDSRVLDQITIFANDGGTLTAGRTRFVDPVTGDDGNDGLTALTAYETIDAAIDDLQTTFGNCKHCRIYLADSDYAYGTLEAPTTPDGAWLEFAAAPGSTPRAVRFATDDGGFGGIGVKLTDIDVYQIDLTNGVAGARLWHHGNSVCTGLGQTDETYVFYNAGNYPAGVWASGHPVDVSAITPGDVAAFKTAALDKFVRWQQTASFPFALQLKRNVFALETAKDTGVQYDRLVQNLIDDNIDPQASGFHADVIHELFTGGDRNLFVDGLIGTELVGAQSWFSRNGAEDPDDPDCNIAFRNHLMRGPSGANGQWMKSASNISWDYVTAPNGTLTIIDDAGTPQENHMSFVRIRRSVVALQTLTEIGQSYVVDRCHFANAAFGTNGTTGGTETDWYGDPSTDDYSLIPDSDIETAAGARSCSRDALGQSRADNDGATGAFAGSESSLDPPVIDYPDSPITADIRDAIDTSPTNGSAKPTTYAEFAGDSLADFGLAIDAATGRVTGTLTNYGTMTTVIRATNEDGHDDATLIIDISNIAPVVSYGGSTIRRVIDRPLALTPGTGLGGIIPPTGAYALHSGAFPTGISLNADTGVISGTPTVLESQTFTVRVTNEIGFYDTTHTLIIVEGTGGGGPIIGHGPKVWKRRSGIFSPPMHDPQGERQ